MLSLFPLCLMALSFGASFLVRPSVEAKSAAGE